MSHFTVAVFTTEGGKSIEELLAPYQENNMGDCPKKYLTFNDVTEEYLKKYAEDTTPRIKTPDGQMFYPWDERFRVSGQIGIGSNTHKVPEDQGYERVEVPFKEEYPDFETFMEDYAGLVKNVETGKYGYWENPNAQWDWWTIGGRWSGMLLSISGDMVDSAVVKDIDWHKMREKNKTQAELNWEEAKKESGPMQYLGYGVKKDDTKESYIERQTEFGTYAVITSDGEWHSKGKMGWWGCSSETEQEGQEWSDSFFERFIKNSDPGLMLTIIDCHI